MIIQVFFRKSTVMPLLSALGLSIVILVLGLGVSFLLPKVPMTISVILAITTFGVAASFIPKITEY